MSLEPEARPVIVIPRASGGGRPLRDHANKENPRRLLAKPPGSSGVLLEGFDLMAPTRSVNPRSRLERGKNRLRHLVNRSHSVDLDQLPSSPVVGRHPRRIAVIGREPRPEDFGI